MRIYVHLCAIAALSMAAHSAAVPLMYVYIPSLSHSAGESINAAIVSDRVDFNTNTSSEVSDAGVLERRMYVCFNISSPYNCDVVSVY